MSRIAWLTYRTGLVERLEDAKHLRAMTIDTAGLPEPLLILTEQHLLDLAGTCGDPSAGDPIQYDELVIEHDRGTVEIIV